MNPFAAIDLPRVINAAGKMTYLGSSAVSDQVAKYMGEAAQSYVDMAQLKEKMDEKISALTGAEAACVTSCAAAGIATSIAACLTGVNLARVESLPHVDHNKKEVILQKGHAVNFGANMTQIIQMTGAAVKEIGTVNGTRKDQLEHAITEDTAAILYVISHHALANNMLQLAEVVQVAQKHRIPVIVDAAAEVDLHKYVALGASLVVYSGHKAIGGPTSGLIIGEKQLIRACHLQEKGIARTMKIGKENIMGFFYALQEYTVLNQADVEARYKKIIKQLNEACADIPGIETKIGWDATRPIPRLQLVVKEENGITARELISQLEAHNPSIRTRNHQADEGIIQFDPRELKSSEIPIIKDALSRILTNKGTFA